MVQNRQGQEKGTKRSFQRNFLPSKHFCMGDHSLRGGGQKKRAVRSSQRIRWGRTGPYALAYRGGLLIGTSSDGALFRFTP